MHVIPSGMTIPPIELSIVAVDVLLFNILVSNFGSRANQGEILNSHISGLELRVKDFRKNLSIPWTKNTLDSALSCCSSISEWLDISYSEKEFV